VDTRGRRDMVALPARSNQLVGLAAVISMDTLLFRIGRTYVLHRLLLAGLVAVFSVFVGGAAQAVTYTSVQNGNWTAGATWVGGVAPGSTINAADSVVINHSVTYNTGADLSNNGLVRIESLNSSVTGALIVPAGRNLFNRASGRWIMNYGKIQQCRFVGCADSGIPQAGKLDNEGGQMTVTFSFVEIAQDWTNLSNGLRRVESSCVKTGQNFSQTGGSNTDRIIDTSISVGWHGSGNIQYDSGTYIGDRARYQLAGTSGNFQVASAVVVSGDIDYITLRNHTLGLSGTNPGSGQIQVNASAIGSVNLDAYFTRTPIASFYIPNGHFTGTQLFSDQPVSGVTYFPDSKCSYANNFPASALLSISKTNGTASVVAGSNTTYTIVVANGGPSNAAGATVRDPVAPGLSCTAVSCSVSGGTATCPGGLSISALQSSPGVTLTSFPAASSLTFSLTCGVTATGL
jgi:uncharacterized repeat protein (TIGR01451 family)